MEEAKKYIQKLYRQQTSNPDSREEGKSLYLHHTCATDTDNIRKVFSDIKDTVLLRSLREYGIF